MADAVVFQIEDGQFALKVVDKAAVGYLDSWQAPGGKTAETAMLADYDVSSATFMCQVTSGALSASPDTTTVDVPATFCNPGKTIPTPGQTSYSLDLSFLQDPNIAAGLSRYLFENDTAEAYFLLGLDGVNPPKAIGRVRLVAGTVGGDARSTLTADASLPLSRKPDIAFGDANDSVIIAGDGTVTPATLVAPAAAQQPAMSGSTTSA